MVAHYEVGVVDVDACLAAAAATRHAETQRATCLYIYHIYHINMRYISTQRQAIISQRPGRPKGKGSPMGMGSASAHIAHERRHGPGPRDWSNPKLSCSLSQESRHMQASRRHGPACENEGCAQRPQPMRAVDHSLVPFGNRTRLAREIPVALLQRCSLHRVVALADLLACSRAALPLPPDSLLVVSRNDSVPDNAAARCVGNAQIGWYD